MERNHLPQNQPSQSGPVHSAEDLDAFVTPEFWDAYFFHDNSRSIGSSFGSLMFEAPSSEPYLRDQTPHSISGSNVAAGPVAPRTNADGNGASGNQQPAIDSDAPKWRPILGSDDFMSVVAGYGTGSEQPPAEPANPVSYSTHFAGSGAGNHQRSPHPAGVQIGQSNPGAAPFSTDVARNSTGSHQQPTQSSAVQMTQPSLGFSGGPRTTSSRRLWQASATLSALPGIIGILRYSCGCQSLEGICNHHSFACGLALPDGIVCARCVGRAERKEIKVTRKCPSHRQEEYDREFDRLKRLGHSKESAKETLPAIPDFVQDFLATTEQRFLCEKHLNFTLAGVESKLEAIIRSWSEEQKKYHDKQRASLKDFPSIFSAERVKW